MKKNLIFSFFFVILSIQLCGFSIGYDKFNSIEEVIAFETECIQNIPSKNYIALADAYLSRGESFLILDDANKALEDLQLGYQLALFSDNDNGKSSMLFRALFGMLIAYSNLGIDESVTPIEEELNSLIDAMQNECMQNCFANITTCSNNDQSVEILGPDYNVSGWCEEVVNGTAEAMRFLAALPKSKTARMSLLGIISALETKCLKCCASGEFWKICVAPIVSKWKQWNDIPKITQKLADRRD